MNIFDTHAHYFDGRFEKEAEGGADAILRMLMPDPVSYIVNVGTNLDSSRAAVAQAAKWEGMYAAIGIHPEDMQNVFRNGYSTKGSGRGTGLCQVKQMVENLNGQITLESQVGAGTTVTVRFGE